ncbi:MAG: hypothetical protein WBM43_04910 [Flavobacteriaceae bacterium]
MRKLMIGIFLLGLTSLTYGQETEGIAQEVELAEVTLTAINSDYLRAVQDHQTPAAARALESMAANFNLKDSPAYNRIENAFEVSFRNSQGSIYAVYDKEGELISAFENIKNVSPPMSLRKQICQENPGWTIAKSKYQVTYIKGKDPVRKYKAQLRSGKKKMRLKYELEDSSVASSNFDKIVSSSLKL